MQGQELTFVPIPADRQSKTDFLMLREGHVAFTGTASELRASTDPYLQSFLS